MIKKRIGKICRYLRNFFNKYCTIGMDETAKGLASCLVEEPPTKEEKRERLRQRLLTGVNKSEEENVLEHFRKLGKEIDPLNDTNEIVDDSVKKVEINVSAEDVQARLTQLHEEDNRSKAERIIKGGGKWPVPVTES